MPFKIVTTAWVLFLFLPRIDRSHRVLGNFKLLQRNGPKFFKSFSSLPQAVLSLEESEGFWVVNYRTWLYQVVVGPGRTYLLQPLKNFKLKLSSSIKPNQFFLKNQFISSFVAVWTLNLRSANLSNHPNKSL